jgi:hypothetical protein
MHSYTSMSSWMLVASAIVLVATTYFAPWSQPATQRPFVAEQTATRPFSSEKVRARLWQDPLEVGWKRIGTAAAGDAESAESKTRRLWKEWLAAPHILRSLIAEDEYDSLFFLPIVLSGEPYPELRERRLRYRFALQEAMETMDYRPHNYDYLYYFPVPLASKSQVCCQEGGLQLFSEPAGSKCRDLKKGEIIALERCPPPLKQEDFVPVTYELFEYIGKSTDHSPQHVLVFWIDNHIINKGTTGNYRNLETIATYLAPEMRTHSRLSVLTLSGSDELLNLIERGDESLLPEDPEMRINYAVSTAPKSQLVRKLKGREINHRIADQLSRTSPSDDYMVAAVIDELQRRIPGLERRGKGTGEDVGDTGNGEREVTRIWLLSEQDTFYSQVMKDEFEKITKERGLDVEIKSIGFLKGIDGNLPNDLGAAKTEHTRAINNLADVIELFDRSGAPEQRLFDRRQTDYLQRLAEKLQLDEREKSFDQRVKAIGILGGDVYDKMLVLEVFRHYFPATHYFTTDLDSAYLYGPGAKTARNLVIGSAFGLSPNRLGGDYENSIVNEGGVVFRDSYQTALYHSILKLLLPDEEQKKLETGNRGNFRIQLFEVGRSRFHLLEVGDESERQGRYYWRYPANLANEADPNSICDSSKQGLEPIGNGKKSQSVSSCGDKGNNRGSPQALLMTEIPNNEKPFSLLDRYGPGCLQVLVAFFAALILIMSWIFVRYSQKFELFSEDLEPSSPYLIWHMWTNALQTHTERSYSLSDRLLFWGLGIFLMLPVAILLFVSLGLAAGPRNVLEPMFWMEGISAWPSIILRLLVVLGGSLMLTSSLAGNQIAIARLNTRLKNRKVVRTHLDTRGKHDRPSPIDPLTRDLFMLFLLVVTSITVMFVIFLLSKEYSDGFFTPGRGHWIFLAHQISIAMSMSMLLVLLWWAAFRHHRCRTFLVSLGKELSDRRKSTAADPSSDEKTGATLSASEVNALEDYAGFSSVTLLPPFAMMVLLVVSRHTIFDGWNIPLVLFVLLGAMLFVLLFSAFRLSSAARRLKLAEIKYHKIRSEPDKRRREIAEMASVWEDAAGPFGKYQQQPIIQALVFAAAGFGISFVEPMFRLFGF